MGFGLGSVLMNLGMRSESDQVSVDAITLFVLLLCTCIIIGHLLEKSRWINESITALTIGICTGIVLLLTTEGKSSHILVFNEEFFFIYLLPPIIFNAGFQVKKKQFFRNFMTITLFGVVGTLISFFIISLGSAQLFKMLNVGFVEMGDCFALGAIFSATDSVCTLQVLNQDETPLLYSLVFGEGVVNDATSVVLFNALQRFDLSHITSGIATRFAGSLFNLFFTSTLLGVAVGLLCAYIIKKLYFGRHSTDREVALMILMAYLSYMMAELFSLSGILTVFFCGIVMSHYTWHNVTENSRVTTKHAFATMSFISEIFIFLYVGMDALDIEKWRSVSKSPGTSVGVSTILLGLVVLGRAAFVFPLSFISNLTKKSPDDKISFKQQFTRSGHTQLRVNAIMITSTISIILFSTVVFGLLTKPLIRFLLPLRKPLSSMAESEASSLKSLTLPLLEIGQDPEVAMNGQNGTTRPSSLRMLFTTPTHTVHYY
ncbi:sodium/hydrogen exchanger 1-like isoform X2 [Syzygium oleosum]|uniref:sodium/hydrogen exchanger 1-like isoform X2 n=1 Tax=Syzygium oleosum TaxID=219896 RepID=UPI0024BAD237|nr:sodium/hydrogen exchanger 1-like isoform X2 [Syzygium oleosum]